MFQNCYSDRLHNIQPRKVYFSNIHICTQSSTKQKQGNTREQEVKTGLGSGFEPMTMAGQAHT